MFGFIAKLDLILKHTRKIMSSLDDLKAAVARVGTAVDGAKTELAADAQSIKDLTAKLATLGPSDADVEDVVSQLNGIADGLAPKVDPVAAAVSAVPATPATPAS